jgi:hypothetical protein
MEANTTSALSIASIVTSILGAVYVYMKHSKCHSKCCGKEVDASIDLTPVPSDQLTRIKVVEKEDVV